MTTITFDTLELKTAGIPQTQTEAIVRVIAEAQNGLVTKHDLTEAKNKIKADMNVRFERINGELKLNRWMLSVLLAGAISLVFKVFFLMPGIGSIKINKNKQIYFNFLFSYISGNALT